MHAPLNLTRQNAVARVRMQRGDVHNAFDGNLIAALTQTFAALDMDPSVRVVILEAEGASFSAGADLNWMRGMTAMSEEENRIDSLALARLMRQLDGLTKPVIARVQGSAFGGGVGLIACCDIAIGATSAQFGLTESKLGLLPAVISPYLINAIGPRQARRYFATAEVFDATEAHRIGLLHDVVEPNALDATVDRLTQTLLTAAPSATGLAKTLVRDVMADKDPAAQDERNAALIASMRVSVEGQEGLAAFLEKREPKWTNA